MELVFLPVIITTLGLVVWQQIFWARQVQQLVDKLMSKSFIEYQQAAKPVDVKPREKLQLEPEEDLGRI